MGMVEEMHNLCEDIVTSRFDRGEVIRGIKSDTEQILTDAKNIVEDFSAERKEMGDELRSDLKEAVKTIKADTTGKLREFSDARTEMSKEMAKELKEYTTGIRTSVTDLRTDFTEERVKMGRELRKELGKYNSGIKKDVGNLLSDFSAGRMKTVEELKEMHEEWQRMVKPKAAVKEEAKLKEEEVVVGEAELGKLKEKVLEIINAAPHGLSLTGIGLILDVEWRKLIRPAKELLEEGRIRKEDVNYFPLEEEEKEEREER
ncbi:MAG: hypothetical protein WAV32_07360 [Halobacteriota archaeon]